MNLDKIIIVRKEAERFLEKVEVYDDRYDSNSHFRDYTESHYPTMILLYCSTRRLF